MRRRGVLILLLVAALAGRVVPCDAISASASESHACCDQEACPSWLAEAADELPPGAPADDCCAISDARRTQQAAREVTGAVTPVADLPVAFAARELSPHHLRPKGPPVLPRSAPLHLLFGVFLV